MANYNEINLYIGMPFLRVLLLHMKWRILGPNKKQSYNDFFSILQQTHWFLSGLHFHSRNLRVHCFLEWMSALASLWWRSLPRRRCEGQRRFWTLSWMAAGPAPTGGGLRRQSRPSWRSQHEVGNCRDLGLSCVRGPTHPGEEQTTMLE